MKIFSTDAAYLEFFRMVCACIWIAVFSICCADFEMATNKKKKIINLKEKIEVVKEFRSGRPVADIAQHY